MKYLSTLLALLAALSLYAQPKVLTKTMDSSRNYYSLYEDGTWTKDEPRKRSEVEANENREIITTGTDVDSVTAIVVNGEDLASLDIDYMRVFAAPKLLSGKVMVGVDFGQRFRAFGGRDQILLKDQNDNQILLNTEIDALNLFAKHGFELVQVYQTTDSVNGTYTNYLMRRMK